jgi:hypothetical protein
LDFGWLKKRHNRQLSDNCADQTPLYDWLGTIYQWIPVIKQTAWVFIQSKHAEPKILALNWHESVEKITRADLHLPYEIQRVPNILHLKIPFLGFDSSYKRALEVIGG